MTASLVWPPWNQHSASLAARQTTEHSVPMRGKSSLQWDGRAESGESGIWYKGAKNGGWEGRWERAACLHVCHSTDPTTGTYLAANPPGHWPWQLYRGNLHVKRNCSATMSLICWPQNFSFFLPRKRGKCMEKHILFFYSPLYPLLQGQHSRLIVESFLYGQCVLHSL